MKRRRPAWACPDYDNHGEEAVCGDCLAKFGIDVALEALREYLLERGRSMDDLMRAATASRVARVILPYVQALS